MRSQESSLVFFPCLSFSPLFIPSLSLHFPRFCILFHGRPLKNRRFFSSGRRGMGRKERKEWGKKREEGEGQRKERKNVERNVSEQEEWIGRCFSRIFRIFVINPAEGTREFFTTLSNTQRQKSELLNDSFLIFYYTIT